MFLTDEASAHLGKDQSYHDMASFFNLLDSENPVCGGRLQKAFKMQPSCSSLASAGPLSHGALGFLFLLFLFPFYPPSLDSAYESEHFVPWRNNINKSCDQMTFLKSRFGWMMLFTAVSLLWLQMPGRMQVYKPHWSLPSSWMQFWGS